MLMSVAWEDMISFRDSAKLVTIWPIEWGVFVICFDAPRLSSEVTLRRWAFSPLTFRP